GPPVPKWNDGWAPGERALVQDLLRSLGLTLAWVPSGACAALFCVARCRWRRDGQGPGQRSGKRSDLPAFELARSEHLCVVEVSAAARYLLLFRTAQRTSVHLDSRDCRSFCPLVFCQSP